MSIYILPRRKFLHFIRRLPQDPNF